MLPMPDDPRAVVAALTELLSRRGHERGCPAIYGRPACACGLTPALVRAGALLGGGAGTAPGGPHAPAYVAGLEATLREVHAGLDAHGGSLPPGVGGGIMAGIEFALGLAQSSPWYRPPQGNQP